MEIRDWVIFLALILASLVRKLSVTFRVLDAHPRLSSWFLSQPTPGIQELSFSRNLVLFKLPGQPEAESAIVR